MDTAVGYMQASGAGHRRYLFGEFVLDIDRGALLLAGADVPLRPKSFEVLSYLVLHAGLLVTKEQLLTEIWQNVVVTDDSLTHCMIDIRKALGDNSREIVRTVRGRGYLLDLPVSSPDPGEGLVAHSLFRHNRRSSPHWMGFTVVLLLAAGLSQIYKDIPKAIFELQNEDTTSVAASVKDRALEHYQQGEFFNARRAPGDDDRAIEHFRRAVAIDPGMADAWVGLAGTLMVQHSLDKLAWPELAVELGQALSKALELDPTHAEAHVMMGQYVFLILGDKALAEAHFRKAWQYGRNDAQMLARLAGLALAKHKLDEALYLQRQAVALDTLGFIPRLNLAVMLYWSDLQAEAEAEFLYAKVLSPANHELVDKDLVLVLILRKKYADAEQLLLNMDSSPHRDKGLALVYRAQGELSRSEEAVDRLAVAPGVEPAIYLAEFYAYIGDLDSSMDWLAVASNRYFADDYFQQDWSGLLTAFFSPFLRPLSDDPRLLAWRSATLERDERERVRSVQFIADAGL